MSEQGWGFTVSPEQSDRGGGMGVGLEWCWFYRSYCVWPGIHLVGIEFFSLKGL